MSLSAALLGGLLSTMPLILIGLIGFSIDVGGPDDAAGVCGVGGVRSVRVDDA